MDTSYHLTVNDNFEFSITENECDALDVQRVQAGRDLHRVQAGRDLHRVQAGRDLHMPISTTKLHILKDNHSVDAEIISADFINKTYTVKVNSSLYDVKIGTPLDDLINKMGLTLGEVTAVNDIKAPMPGLILDVLVKPGDTVKAGDYILVLEAMKMENTLTAPGDGVVKSVLVVKGNTVDKGEILVEME